MKLRNIKFKAKRLDNGEWVKGSLVKTPFGTFIEWYEDSICNKREVNSDTVCQFTGLKDCKGNEVWEGDILEGSNKGEICFEQGAFLIRSIDDNALFSLSNYATWNGMITCKVVGNKFDKEKRRR